jgi:GntR family transcriptional regulator, vanillate catabolism transcriptional regulator
MQDRANASTNPKNWFTARAGFQRDSGPLVIGHAGDFKMSDKSELRVLDPSVGSRLSDVASQTARALFRLRESLLRGEFAPGERMSELPLVARLGVSRTPIRLALERLAHIGLLDLNASGGFTVRGYTPSEALDAIEIRGVVEGTAARLASERLVDKSELETLRRLGEQMDRLERLTLDSFAHYMDLNEAFHATIIDLAKSAILTRAFQQAVSLPFASPSAMVFPTSGLAYSDAALAVAKEHHRSLIEAIATRQGTRAENLAREHAFIARRVLTMALSDTDALSKIPGASLIDLTGERTRVV